MEKLKNIVIERGEQKDRRPKLMYSIEFLCLGEEYSHGKHVFIKLRYILRTSNYYNRLSGYSYETFFTTTAYGKNHLYSEYRRPTTNELYWLVLNIMSREEVF